MWGSNNCVRVTMSLVRVKLQIEGKSRGNESRTLYSTCRKHTHALY